MLSVVLEEKAVLAVVEELDAGVLTEKEEHTEEEQGEEEQQEGGDELYEGKGEEGEEEE